MLADVAATAVAFALFALFVFLPGYGLAWALDLLGFRRRATLLQRLVIAVPVSIGAFPALTYLTWRWSASAVWALFGASWLVFIVALRDRRAPRLPISRTTLAVGAIVVAWIVVGMACLIDMQIGGRLYFPTVSYDYMLRTAITSSITRSGVPPDNPYFFPGRSFPLRYHYFWFLPCSLVDRLGGSSVDARQAMIAGTLWCGIGVIALIALYLRFFQPRGEAGVERRTLIAVALLGVTGLDVIPITLVSMMRGAVVESLEWWNGPIMGWVHAVLWVPHHVAALIACFTGFLVVYYSFDAAHADRLRRTTAAIAAGAMFASGVGLSIYVTMVFAAALGVLVVLLTVNRYWREGATLASSGIVAVVVALPYLRSLAGGGAAAVGETGGGTAPTAGPLLQFAVRPFLIPDAIVQTLWPNRPWAVPLTDLLLLPLNYFLELGFFLLVAIWMVRRLRRQPQLTLSDLSAVSLVATSVLICTFFRSSVISNNDLGWRGFLVAQFVLLIWAAELWDEGVLTAPARAGLVAVCVMFGVAGTIYELSMIRFYTFIADHFTVPNSAWFVADRHLGERTYALRGLYEDLRQRVPTDGVLQHNPNQVLGDVFHGLYADRQTAVETPSCGVVFGGTSDRCNEAMPLLSTIFNEPAIDWSSIEAACERFAIDAIVVKNTDRAIWSDRSTWVWTRQPVVANDYARVFSCGCRGTAGGCQ
jgi:hypothetical protein